MHLDLLSIPQSGGKNVETFRWDQWLKILKKCEGSRLRCVITGRTDGRTDTFFFLA